MSRDRVGHLWVLYAKSVPRNGLWERRGLECDADEPRFTAPGDRSGPNRPLAARRSCWRRPMQLMLIVVAAAVAMLLDLRVSQGARRSAQGQAEAILSLIMPRPRAERS